MNSLRLGCFLGSLAMTARARFVGFNVCLMEICCLGGINACLLDIFGFLVIVHWWLLDILCFQVVPHVPVGPSMCSKHCSLVPARPSLWWGFLFFQSKKGQYCRHSYKCRNWRSLCSSLAGCCGLHICFRSLLSWSHLMMLALSTFPWLWSIFLQYCTGWICLGLGVSGISLLLFTPAVVPFSHMCHFIIPESGLASLIFHFFNYLESIMLSPLWLFALVSLTSNWALQYVGNPRYLFLFFVFSFCFSNPYNMGEFVPSRSLPLVPIFTWS